MEEAMPTLTPISVGTRLDKDEESPVTKTPCQDSIGTLLYLANTIGLDIAFKVGRLCIFCSDQREVHWTAAKRVVRYLQGTWMMGIEYRKGKKAIGYSDSKFARDLADRKYTTGSLFKLAGGVVKWRSKKQTIVSLSTPEA